MITTVALAAAFAAGVDWRKLGLLAFAVVAPHLAAIAIAALVWRFRDRRGAGAAVFCEGVAAELRAGAVLRTALVVVARSVGVDLDEEAPIPVLAGEIAAAFPDVAQALELTVVVAHRAGSDTAALFDELAAMSVAQTETANEIQMATAPAKATAAVLLGSPVLYLVSQGGGIATRWADVPQRVAGTLGLSLFFLGVVGTGLTLRWAGR